MLLLFLTRKRSSSVGAASNSCRPYQRVLGGHAHAHHAGAEPDLRGRCAGPPQPEVRGGAPAARSNADVISLVSACTRCPPRRAHTHRALRGLTRARLLHVPAPRPSPTQRCRPQRGAGHAPSGGVRVPAPSPPRPRGLVARLHLALRAAAREWRAARACGGTRLAAAAVRQQIWPGANSTLVCRAHLSHPTWYRRCTGAQQSAFVGSAHALQARAGLRAGHALQHARARTQLPLTRVRSSMPLDVHCSPRARLRPCACAPPRRRAL
jgi:hypothetical protein